MQSHAGNGIVRAQAVIDDLGAIEADVHRLRALVEGIGGYLVVARCPAERKESLSVWGNPRPDWAWSERVKAAPRPRRGDEPGPFRWYDLAGLLSPRRVGTAHHPGGYPGWWAVPTLRDPADAGPLMPSPTPAPPTAATDGHGVDLAWLREKIDYRLYQQCVHCGLCTASCPTYVELGDENDGPRGRIYLMRAVADGRLGASEAVRHHLGLCLDCRACESACPSGVQYGRIIEPFKVALANSAPKADRPSLIQRIILEHLFPYAGRVKLALGPARFLQRWGVLDWFDKVGLTRLLPPTLRKLQAMLPRLVDEARAAAAGGDAARRREAGARGALPRLRGRRDVPRDQRRDGPRPPPQRLRGRRPRGPGLLRRDPLSLGHRGPGVRPRARRTCTPSTPTTSTRSSSTPPAAGRCSRTTPISCPPQTMRRPRSSSTKVRDISEFLVELGPIRPTRHVPQKVTYHDACHLCHGQQVRNQPRQLLAMIPGLELLPLEESELCCGAAGTYNLTEPEMSDRLGRRKLERIEATGAEAVAVGNVGCILQIARQVKERGDAIEVAHPVDLLDRSYGPIPPDA